MTIDSAIGVISRWSSVAERKLFVFDGSKKETDQYLQAVDDLQNWLKSAPPSDHRSEAESALAIAMRRLADEFWNLLKLNAESHSSLNPNSTTYSSTMTDTASGNYQVYEDDYANHNAMSLEVIYNLRRIAVRMNSGGFIHDCVIDYIRQRKPLMNVGFQGFNKLTGPSVRKMEWGDLESKIKAWIKCSRICFNHLFETEKGLSQQIFHGLGEEETADSCFLETVKYSAIEVLEAAESLSYLRPASKKLFKILDLYDTLSGLLPQIDKLFHTHSSEFIRKKAAGILPKLVDAAGKSLLEFENALVNEQSPVVHGEMIPHLPKYVIDYMYKLGDHKKILMEIALPKPPSPEMSVEALNFEGKYQLSTHVVWIIMALVSTLEGKAKQIGDASASWLFAMNNVNYVVQKIKERQEVMEMVEDECIDKLTGKLDQAKEEYIRITFEKVFDCLRDEELDGRWKVFPFRDSSKDRLKRFNAAFKKVHSDLAKLVIPDFQLVKELRDSIREKLVPSYTSFHLCMKSVPSLKPYVKYSTKSLETAILDFFSGSPKA